MSDTWLIEGDVPLQVHGVGAQWALGILQEPNLMGLACDMPTSCVLRPKPAKTSKEKKEAVAFARQAK